MKDIEEDKKEQQETQPAPAPSVVEMEQTHADELAGLQQANQQRYTDVGQIVSEAEAKLAQLKQKDETAQKRSNAFRYIAGLGDTLSGIANLVGTAHGAQNQQQVYNGGRVAERAEQSRKERKLEMDNMNTRIDEMRARQRELKTAGSLAEAEMKARQARELATEKNRLAALEREDKYRAQEQAWREAEAARAQANTDATLAENKRQFDITNKRLADAAAAENASREKTKQMELDQKNQQEAIKRALDPKYQAQIFQQNLTGIRDEIAEAAGYKDYNEYLQYANNKKVGDKSRRQTRKFREANEYNNPEALELLGILEKNPEMLSEEQIRMLAGASRTFNDALGASLSTKAEAPKEEAKFDEQGREILDY